MVWWWWFLVAREKNVLSFESRDGGLAQVWGEPNLHTQFTFSIFFALQSFKHGPRFETITKRVERFPARS
jgi:hypothetical protein